MSGKGNADQVLCVLDILVKNNADGDILKKFRLNIAFLVRKSKENGLKMQVLSPSAWS
jgi:hypothetical protein